MSLALVNLSSFYLIAKTLSLTVLIISEAK